MTNTTFQRRRIDVTITLGQGHWGENLGDTMTLTGYRVRCTAQTFGGDAAPEAQIQIYGMPFDTMNKVTRYAGFGALKAMDRVAISAGTEGEALSTYFDGSAVEAVSQMQDAPNTCLSILGMGYMDIALKPVAASSYAGACQVSNIMADFAKEAGLAFEDNGVQVVLRNPYFPGTTLAKIKSCARAAHIFFSIDNGVLAIWPQWGSRQQQEIPVISPKNGMLGYPAYSKGGVTVRTLLNSQFRLGDKFTIADSLVTPANGTWTVIALAHTMESQTPNGAWFTDITGSLLGQ